MCAQAAPAPYANPFPIGGMSARRGCH